MSRVRPVRFPEELEAVQTLLREYAAAMGCHVCFVTFEKELATLPGEYAGNGGGFWIAEEGTEFVGCVAVRRINDQDAELKRMYVKPAFRGRGLAWELVAEALTQAKHWNYDRVCLDTLPEMVEAIGLYRSMGFVEVPPYTANPVPGAINFAKRIC